MVIVSVRTDVRDVSQAAAIAIGGTVALRALSSAAKHGEPDSWCSPWPVGWDEGGVVALEVEQAPRPVRLAGRGETSEAGWGTASSSRCQDRLTSCLSRFTVTDVKDSRHRSR
jgi:hypothetical protein